MFHSLPWFKPHSYYCIYWAWRSWTVSWSAQGMRRIIVLTVFCPKQLHISQYNTLWWHIVKPLKPDQGLDKLPTTQSVWLEHTRRSQVQAWPSFVSSAISIGSVFWHLSSSAQLHSSVQTRLFRLQEHLHEHLLVDSTLLDPHMHRMSLMSMYLLVAITVACHLALSSKRERFRDDMVNEQELRPRKDVWSHTPRVCGSLSTPWSGFSCLKRCHPIVFVWDLWSCLGQQSEYKNYSHPVTTTTDGSASSPSSISATRTLGLIKEACEASLFPFPCIQLRARSRTSVSYEYMWTFCPYSATSTACKIMIVSTSSGVRTLVPHEVPSLQWHFCGSRSPGSQTYSDWWVVEPGKEWANILYHYLKRMCVCFWCKFHLLKKDIWSRSLGLASSVLYQRRVLRAYLIGNTECCICQR